MSSKTQDTDLILTHESDAKFILRLCESLSYTRTDLPTSIGLHEISPGVFWVEVEGVAGVVGLGELKLPWHPQVVKEALHCVRVWLRWRVSPARHIKEPF